jgi:hypothetical protein
MDSILMTFAIPNGNPNAIALAGHQPRRGSSSQSGAAVRSKLEKLREAESIGARPVAGEIGPALSPSVKLSESLGLVERAFRKRWHQRRLDPNCLTEH